MSKKKDMPFGLKQLNDYKPEDLRLVLVQNGDDVHRCTVDEKKRFLGMFFERWVHRADLMDPIRKVDNEIQAAKDKLAELENKRESEIRQARTIVASIPTAWDCRSYKIGGKDSKPSVNGVFNTPEPSKKEKPKMQPRVLEGIKAGPVQQQKQNNGKGH